MTGAGMSRGSEPGMRGSASAPLVSDLVLWVRTRAAAGAYWLKP
jgi:hypothetical protein